jgi:hypothetical protein
MSEEMKSRLREMSYLFEYTVEQINSYLGVFTQYGESQ